MFTGIIKYLVNYNLENSILSLYFEDVNILDKCNIGDSVCVNGVCLTITSIDKDNNLVKFFVMKETLNITNFCKNGIANVEFSLQHGEYIGGHCITGHIDTMGTIEKIMNEEDGSRTITISYPCDFESIVIYKDSISLNGISLTISKCDVEANCLCVSIIPHTYDNTNIKYWKISDKVNIEFNNKNIVHNEKKIMVTKEEFYMKYAIKLSEKTKIKTLPNPWVGCVLVYDDKIIGEGYHEKKGYPHAEIEAINDAINKGNKELIKKSILYVTLEPCYPEKGKDKINDPCYKKIVEMEIKKVVIGMKDPDVRTSGKSISKLKENGIEVLVGVCKNDIELSLKEYLYCKNNNRPFGIGKIALSKDCCYSRRDKKQVWITSEQSVRHSENLISNCVQAVIEGDNTVKNDLEVLNERVKRFQNKSGNTLWIYLDTDGSLPAIEQCHNVWVYTTIPSKIYYKKYEDKKSRPTVRTIKKDCHGNISLYEITNDLYKRGIYVVLYEGGGILQRRLLDLGYISKFWIYQSDLIMSSEGSNWYSTVNLDGYEIEILYNEKIKSCKDTFEEILLKPKSSIKKIQKALLDINTGIPVILMDNMDRENEADLVIDAKFMNEKICELYRRYGTGIICVSMTEIRSMQLNLPLNGINEDVNKTNFTMSCDHVDTKTGVSAKDRSTTINYLGSQNINREMLNRPGHIFPLVSQYGYLNLRQGHTEGSVSLCSLAGTGKVASIVEMVNDDGTMMCYEDCKRFIECNRETKSSVIITMEDLKKYIKYRKPNFFEIVSCADLKIDNYGTWKFFCYNSGDTHNPHVVLIYGDIYKNKNVMVRVHSECFTGDVLKSHHCDCGYQLQTSLKKINENGSGVIIFPSKHEGRGIGLVSKIQAYRAQHLYSIDTYKANNLLELPLDNRDYKCVKKILDDLNIKSIILLTENTDKINQLKDYIFQTYPLKNGKNETNKNYLEAKSNYFNKIKDPLTSNQQTIVKDTSLILSTLNTLEETDEKTQKEQNSITAFNDNDIILTSDMKKLNILILCTYWHKQEVDLIVDNMISELLDRGIYNEKITIKRVPGCFDIIPALNIYHEAYDVIICTGFLLKGITDHYRYTSEGVMKGLIETSINIKKPIINGIFNCTSKEQIKNKANISSGAAKSFAISCLLMMKEFC